MNLRAAVVATLYMAMMGLIVVSPELFEKSYNLWPHQTWMALLTILIVCGVITVAYVWFLLYEAFKCDG